MPRPSTKTKSLTFEERLRLEAAKESMAIRNIKSDFAKQFVEEATKDVPWQRDFVYDKNPMKALFGERRGSKTTVMAICGIEQCLRVPYSKVLYIGLTKDSCERAMYNEILPRLIRKHNLDAKLVDKDQMIFGNGSIIYLIGLDANTKQKERVRGVKSSLNMIDEMQSYTQDTSLIINEVLGPTAADTKAMTILGGTAGNALGENYWYEITRDNTKANPIAASVSHPEWMVYRCEWSKNTAIDEMTGNRVCDNIRDYLELQKTKHPGIENSDSWRQEWNAEWIVQKDALIYRYSDANLITSALCTEIVNGLEQRVAMPSSSFLANAYYILGLDLGYNDPTAMTVVAYNLAYSNKLYVIETFYQSEMLVPAVAAKIISLDEHYHFTHMVGDSSSLQVFETMRQTYSLPIEKANRLGKLSHQYVLNGDLQTRSVVFMPGNEELIKQLKTVQWLEGSLKNGKPVEDPKYKNDLADSFLYAHHYSRHLWYEVPKPVQRPMNNQQHTDYLTNQLIKKNREADYEFDFAEPNAEPIYR